MRAYFSPGTKAKIEELCKKHRIRELSLFGSRVRGDHTDASDFDLLVDFLPDAQIGLFDFSGIQIELQDLLGRRVDLVSKTGLKPRIKNRVLSEAEIIYEG